MPRPKPSTNRQFQIGLNIDTMLQRQVNVPGQKLGTASQTTAKSDESWDSESWDSSDDESFDSSDSGSDIDEGDFYAELQSWMNKLTTTRKPVTRSNSMQLLGAVKPFPKYKEQISHHPIVANRIRKCDAEFMQSPEEVMVTRKAKEDPSTDKPESCLMRILASAGKNDSKGLEPYESAFLEVTEERVAAHCKEMTDAARSVNMKLLKQFLKEGRNLECCNRFGESIVHIVSRRGSLEGLSFLVEKANASLMVRDDFGRNPLHDAMWTDKPSFDMVKFIFKHAPALLFAKDKRGSTPLAYIPRPRWTEWNNFLDENKELVLAVVL